MSVSTQAYKNRNDYFLAFPLGHLKWRYLSILPVLTIDCFRPLGLRLQCASESPRELVEMGHWVHQSLVHRSGIEAKNVHSDRVLAEGEAAGVRAAL